MRNRANNKLQPFLQLLEFCISNTPRREYSIASPRSHPFPCRWMRSAHPGCDRAGFVQCSFLPAQGRTASGWGPEKSVSAAGRCAGAA